MKHLLLLLFLFASTIAGAAEMPVVKAVLFPFREAVIAARIDSTLQPYKIRVGEKFRTGDILATLDDTRFSIEVKRATEQFNFAKVAFEDRKELRAKNFTSDYELKKAEFDYHMTENNLAEAKLNLSFCALKAPFSGKIVEIQTREYETVRPGQALFRIIDDNNLLAVMNVPMNNKSLTSVGSPVSIRIPGHDKLTATGKVYEVTPQADHRTGTVRIRVLIDNSEGKFTAGMTGELVYGK